MISEQHDNHILLKDEHDDIRGFATFLDSIWDQFTDDNVIIDLTKYDNAILEDFIAYLVLSNNHRLGKKSFVIINDALDVDQIPVELLIVPTYPEAQDIIELEEIERDLGF